MNQLKDLVSENKIQLVNENDLNAMERAVFDASYSILAQVMIDPHRQMDIPVRQSRQSGGI
ncbi:MAG: hypothetical protein K6F14_04245 [Clostridiales bacterium]|nr:hypothetical protein [Clostridiales bacterium]